MASTSKTMDTATLDPTTAASHTPVQASTAPPGDLTARLAAAISGEVRFDDGARALYATNGSNYRIPPIGVVIPRDQDDVIATVRMVRLGNNRNTSGLDS